MSPLWRARVALLLAILVPLPAARAQDPAQDPLQKVREDAQKRADEVQKKAEEAARKEAEDAKKTSDDPKKGDPKKQGGGLRFDTTGDSGPRERSNGEQLFGRWARGLNFSGGWTLSAQNNAVDGSTQARELFNFQNNNAFLNRGSVGPFRQNLNLSLNGKLFNAFDIDANLTNNRVNASLAQLMRIHYDNKKGTVVDLGDVAAQLSGNDLVPFSRNVQGVRFERDLGSGRKVATIASITRALTRRNTLLGQGTSGPYYLGGGQIVPGTERIYLNGQEMAPGKDYRLDYPLGTLYFLEGRIVNRSDTIEYTYESLSFNTSPGVLTGVRADLPFGNGQQFGFINLRQSASGGGRGDGTITEYFPVTVDLNTRYTLASPIKPGTPVVVRYQERILVEGVAADYLVNRELNYIQLRRPLPPDTSVTGLSSLRINYTPVLQLGIQGGRDVMGFDSQLPVGPNARVKFQMAQSRDQARGVSDSGVNFQATVNSPKSQKNRSWSVTSLLSSIGDDFVGIDSTAGALQRNGRTLSTRFTYAAGENFAFSGNLGSSRFPNLGFSSTTSQNTGAVSNTTSDDLGFQVNLKPRTRKGASAPNISLTHQQRAQRTTPVAGATTNATGDSRSRYQSDALSVNWAMRTLDLGLTLDRTASSGRSVFLAGYSGTVGTGTTGSSGGFLGGVRDGSANQSLTDTSTDSIRLNATFTPFERLSLSGNIGVSRIDGGESNSTANNLGLAAQYWVLPERLSADLSFEDSANGQSVSGYFGNPGGNTGGGGVIGGGSGLGFSTGQRTRIREARLHYTPYGTLDLQLGRREELALIPNYDNTRSVFNTATVSFDPAPQFNVTGTLSQQIGSQVGGQGDFDNLNYTLGITHGVQNGLTTRLNYMRMNFGSTSFFSGGTGGLGSGFGGVGGGGGFGAPLLQAGQNDVISLRLDYPLREIVPFLELQNLDASDPLSSPTTGGTGNVPGGLGSFHQATNYRRQEARVGVTWNFSKLLGATLNMNLVRLVDRDDSRYSYRARSFNFDINARF